MTSMNGMARIVRFDRFGGPEVLRISEEAPRDPDQGEVRIKVALMAVIAGLAVYVPVRISVLTDLLQVGLKGLHHFAFGRVFLHGKRCGPAS